MGKMSWVSWSHLKDKSIWFKRFFLFTLAVWGIVLTPQLSRAINIPLNEKGIYSAGTDDGGTVYLYRYAPYTTGTPAFRSGGTPVVLFTGITMNMNQYLSCTPPGMEEDYSIVAVPPVSQAPSWILNSSKTDYEATIKADKMRYYSIAHYLWLQGYDTWLVNYRNTGRTPMHSSGSNDRRLNTLDTWATLDAPAAITKVKSVTGKRMFIGGHSTGGLVSYAYLQGAYMDHGRAVTASEKEAYYKFYFSLGIQPHIKGSAALAKARNADIKGFIGLDPAGVPPLPSTMDTRFFWTLVGSRLFLPLDNVSDRLLQRFSSKALYTVEDLAFGYINDESAAEDGRAVFDYLNFWLVKDMDPCMEDWMVRYSIGGSSIRGFGHYMDMGMNFTIREHYLNGYENYNTKKSGPAPDPGVDGYYYYSQNMSRMTVPMIVFSSSAGALVCPEYTYDYIISQKSATSYDEWYVVKNTAHVDVALGKRMPLEVFPNLGTWLKTVNALPGNPVNINMPASRIDL